MNRKKNQSYSDVWRIFRRQDGRSIDFSFQEFRFLSATSRRPKTWEHAHPQEESSKKRISSPQQNDNVSPDEHSAAQRAGGQGDTHAEKDRTNELTGRRERHDSSPPR